MYFHQTQEVINPVAYLNTYYSTVEQEENESYCFDIWYVSTAALWNCEAVIKE